MEVDAHSVLIIFEQKNLPRKKRRKLEAAREQLDDENDFEELEVCALCSFSFFFVKECHSRLIWNFILSIVTAMPFLANV